MKRLAVQLFLLGAIVGTLGDFTHVSSGTLAYPPADWRIPGSPQPFWVPLLMGSATVSIGFFMRGSLPPPASRRFCWAAPLILMGAYSASGYLPLSSGGARDLVLALVAVGSWWLWDRSRRGLARAFAIGVAGAAFEIAIIALGAFHYVSPNFFSIMSWIPWLYFTAASSLGAFVAWIEERNLQPRAA